MTEGDIPAGSAPQQWSGVFDARRLTEALKAAPPPLLFGVLLWASVCLALYIAFWLELDNPYWAGTSAAIVCQPHLGASLRKGWYRLIGTLVGAMVSVLLTACFPQDRVDRRANSGQLEIQRADGIEPLTKPFAEGHRPAGNDPETMCAAPKLGTGTLGLKLRRLACSSG